MSHLITLFLLALLSLTAPAWATHIYVSGDQTGIWETDTVFVTGEVRVPPGQMLTIVPGVEVLFSVYCKLIVDNNATLRAVGTPEDSIRFDVLPPDTAWHGIRFLSASDSSQVKYCLLTNGSASGYEGDSRGGAIYCYNSDPAIFYNTICGNAAAGGGGIYCGSQSNASIIGNNIYENRSTGYSNDGGGGICCNGSDPSIIDNIINANSANNGGGIYCEFSGPLISDNFICGNSSNAYGGGIGYFYITGGSIRDNLIIGNHTSYLGGGISSDCATLIFDGNTIVGNSATSVGGIFCHVTSHLVNCIIWNNAGQQQVAGEPSASYSDIQGGYPGTGNINIWPAFVDTAQGDYRLQWGSPCINTGNPNPQYNDPDGSRADMGAFYYDQSMPVRILLTPYNQPIEIPQGGGSFQYALHLTNIAASSLTVTGWCNVTLPNGSTYGPVLGPVNVSVGSGQTVSRVRIQAVPAGAPAGMYHYNAFAVAAGDTSFDSFTFTKAGGGDWGLGVGGWSNTGEDFGAAEPPLITHNSSLITSLSPNPFNPSTAISFNLGLNPGRISLKVYDTAGRLVASLVDGWREAGKHEVTFDGSCLSSGLYFIKLQAGGVCDVHKVVLTK
jgi:hypothetical protein